jgi:hypothetical protein
VHTFFSPNGDYGHEKCVPIGPFEVEGVKVADKEYQETFWGERDEECPQLSEANGLYVFSLRNGSNYEPNYVGITKTRTFRKEVFNSANGSCRGVGWN